MKPTGDLELGCVDPAGHRDLFSASSIFIVPGVLREVAPSFFTPQIVSIGPLHMEHKNVQPYRGWKTSYLNSLMSRMPSPPEKILESCTRKVYALLEQIKACYDWTLTCDGSAISEMMVMDACFILELMLKIKESKEKPCLGRWSVVQTILHDLVLLENQIPLFILDEIFQSTILKINPKASLVEFLLPVLSSNNLFKAYINIHNISIVSIPHILFLLHHCYRPQIDKDFQISRLLSDQAWVIVKPNKDPTSLIMGMDLKSCHYGPWNKLTLTMPVLKVYGFTELVLRNLVAYEQCSRRQPRNHITSYVYAMNVLAKTERHVAKLVDSRVLVNYLSSNGAVVSIFNNILKKYEEKCKTSNNGSEIQRSFSSPWNMVALLASVILFTLAIAQTIFTTIKYA